eukprot:scaffold127785_cov23-Tisochrysis_lutea.AAC.2
MPSHLRHPIPSGRHLLLPAPQAHPAFSMGAHTHPRHTLSMTVYTVPLGTSRKWRQPPWVLVDMGHKHRHGKHEGAKEF